MASLHRRARHALRVRLLDAVADATAPALADLRREQDRRFEELSAQLRDLREAMHAREVRDRRDMLAAGEREAVGSSAAFVREAMAGARTFPTPHETLAHALSLAPTGGMALEFGVYSGRTLRQIAAARAGSGVYGFDSFEGLPEDWRAGFRAGTFAVEELPTVEGAELVVGWFADTLPAFLAEHPGPVDLLHLDADLYSSTTTVLELVGPRLRPGSVVVFDEYLNHPGWQDGEHRAWREYVAAHDVDFVYEAFTHDNEQVVAVVTGIRDVAAPAARPASGTGGRA
ncbi:class I SAM-dependent methyltransferase [Actinomycetospora chiangmaiensis]|uniref:class I SAM-dependent methyltransferase n=1 Tax=Actinomycetospora chiangmaiensis TaxID=402650 RepID=UPI0006867386|nr:class I SAM-dependent methyltransferase [Actinomycetospora chiangmaiensis]